MNRIASTKIQHRELGKGMAEHHAIDAALAEVTSLPPSPKILKAMLPRQHWVTSSFNAESAVQDVS
jgi:hypothetical protein